MDDLPCLSACLPLQPAPPLDAPTGRGATCWEQVGKWSQQHQERRRNKAVLLTYLVFTNPKLGPHHCLPSFSSNSRFGGSLIQGPIILPGSAGLQCAVLAMAIANVP